MISVIMSVYNEKKEWLQLSIESILNQTYTNFEFIIILDNPKNETLKKLILKFQEKDKRIKFYINDSNIGLTKSLNKALTYAKGEYIARMDADDISISTRLEKQLNYIKQTDIDILGTNVIKFDDKNNEEFSNFFLKDIDIKQNIFKKNMIAHPTWLVKKEVYKCLNGYREIPATEDYDFLLRAIKYGFVLGNMKEHLLKYRVNNIGVSQTKLLEQKLISSFLAKNIINIEKININDINEYLNKQNITLNKKKRYAKANMYMYYFHVKKNIYIKIKYLLKALFTSYTYFKINHFVKIKNKFDLIFNINKNQYILILKFYLKIFLFSIFRKYFIDIDTSKNKIIYMIDTPQYRNLGDHAIAEAQKSFFKKYFPEYEIYEIEIDRFERKYHDLKKKVKKDDLIVFIGGGNFGIEYFILELHRRKIIKEFKNKIILFPQTLYFGYSNIGLRELKKTIKLYSSNTNLMMFAREKYSYNIMKNNFENQIYLFPDIVLFEKYEDSIKREDCLICMRNDLEKGISSNTQNKIIDLVSKNNKIIYNDTVIANNVLKENRVEELNKILEKIGNSKLVITDRLHGMIFSAITNTPCIVFGNYNYKVRGVYETWLKDINYIYFCTNFNDFEKKLNLLYTIKKKDVVKFDKEFEKMYLIVKEFINEKIY